MLRNVSKVLGVLKAGLIAPATWSPTDRDGTPCRRSSSDLLIASSGIGAVFNPRLKSRNLPALSSSKAQRCADRSGATEKEPGFNIDFIERSQVPTRVRAIEEPLVARGLCMPSSGNHKDRMRREGRELSEFQKHIADQHPHFVSCKTCS